MIEPGCQNHFSLCGNKPVPYSGKSRYKEQNMSAQPQFSKTVSRPAFRLSGHISVPGDKSISHRALILGALAKGTSTIHGLLEAEDIMATVNAIRALGVKVTKKSSGQWQVEGRGMAGLVPPSAPLDFGNSGTGVRLMFGVVAGQDLSAEFIGDQSLSQRPMARVLDPLEKTGARTTSQNGCLPVLITGTANPQAIQHKSQVASAQIKSAILLAGLNANGSTIVTEPAASRDHTENMLRAFGAKVQSLSLADGAQQIILHGPAQLQAQDITVPGDPSSAAFAIVAALIVPGSDITIQNVMTNPTRNGLVRCLQSAGYDVQTENERTNAGEPIADLRVRFGCSAPLCPAPESAVSMIDEYPIAMVLAAFAKGTSRFTGIGELRVKESDRIDEMAHMLRQNGVTVRTGDDWMEVDGNGAVFGPSPLTIKAPPFAIDGDHRIAMSALVLGMGGFVPMAIDDANAIATSYPTFIDDMQKLGARISVEPNSPPLVIAVDGPSASGKGTLARLLARQFNLPYLDTGLLYRAAAKAALCAGINWQDHKALADIARQLVLPIANPEQLRTAEIGSAASKIAAVPAVREALLELQREFAQNPKGAVLDGRDIGTVICPDADVKFWVTASDQVRAERRRAELLQSGQQISYEQMLTQLRERDARDAGRGSAPMKRAENAYLIDTSNLAIDAALQIARQRVERNLADR